jgi:hypothetical protein
MAQGDNDEPELLLVRTGATVRLRQRNSIPIYLIGGPRISV